MFEKSMINKWKKKYKRVFKTELSGIPWYYRRLSVGEIRTISLCEDQEQKELLILQIGVIYPTIKSLNDVPAGASDNLVSLISKVTGATEENILDLVSKERDRLGMSDDYLKWKIEIIKTLNYTPKDVDNMTMDEFVEALVMAEEVQGRPLVSSGKDDGTSVQPDTNNLSSPDEIDNADPGDIANSAAAKLRTEYITNKKRRRRLGRI